MALGDIGSFLPSEGQYTVPGAYDQMLKADALKRSSYLAQMDQFYESLEESQRQFEETLAFKIESRDLEFEFGREELAQEATLAREGYSTQRDIAGMDISFREKELGSREELESRRLDIEARKVTAAQKPLQLGGPSEDEKFSFLKEHLTRFDPKRDPRATSWQELNAGSSPLIWSYGADRDNTLPY